MRVIHSLNYDEYSLFDGSNAVSGVAPDFSIDHSRLEPDLLTEALTNYCDYQLPSCIINHQNIPLTQKRPLLEYCLQHLTTHHAELIARMLHKFDAEKRTDRILTDFNRMKGAYMLLADRTRMLLDAFQPTIIYHAELGTHTRGVAMPGLHVIKLAPGGMNERTLREETEHIANFAVLGDANLFHYDKLTQLFTHTEAFFADDNSLAFHNTLGIKPYGWWKYDAYDSPFHRFAELLFELNVIYEKLYAARPEAEQKVEHTLDYLERHIGAGLTHQVFVLYKALETHSLISRGFSLNAGQQRYFTQPQFNHLRDYLMDVRARRGVVLPGG